MSPGQRGGIIGGVWLVLLGGVFLLQQAMDLGWAQAWPLFVIMAGLGSAASALIGLVGRRIGPLAVVWALIWPLLVLAVGIFLFVDFADLADVDSLELLGRWWPVALIVLGAIVLIGALWPRARAVEEQLSISAAGVARGEVILKFGAGRLEVGRGTPGVLVDGTFDGGVRRTDHGPGRVELETDLLEVFPGFNPQLHWCVRLAPDLPLTLRLEGGASRADLDLSELAVTSLVVKTGASDTRVVLPRAAGAVEVRIEAGAAQVRIEVPEGVAARVHSQVGLGSTTVDEARFPRTTDGWASAGYETAEHRADIRVSGGVGSFRIS
jgi:hypothetical protein